MNTEIVTPRLIGSSDLLGWLRGKLADAEKALRCREDMANAKPISEEEWEKLKAMPGVRVTKGRKLTKAELKDMAEEPRRQKRIAVKCRHEVEMFKAIIAALTQPNAPGDRLPGQPKT
jgi:F420-0:gamma-glutamyl ligase-like protein